MAARLEFAVLAGVVGLVLGFIAAVVLKQHQEAFPIYIVAASGGTFALGGVIAKKEWAHEVIGFFISKIL